MSRVARFLLSILIILPGAFLLALLNNNESFFTLTLIACILWWIWPRQSEEPAETAPPAWHTPETHELPDLATLHDELRTLRAEVQELREEVIILKYRLGKQTPGRPLSTPSASLAVPPAPASHIHGTPPEKPAKPEPAAEKPAPRPGHPANIPAPPAAPVQTTIPAPAATATPATPNPANLAARQTADEPAPATAPAHTAETIAPRTAEADKPAFTLPAFFSENLLLKAGIAILFLGLAFLLRYVSGKIHISIPMRYLGVVLAAVILAAIGWRLRHKRRDYALAVQGAALAILYLTTLAALKLHHLLTPMPAFALMFAISAAMVALAVLQNAHVLAQIALLGGLATPILTASGSNNYIGLFSYLALLNSAVAVIAWFRSWRLLNVTGLTGTLAIATLWGERYYMPDNLAAVEIFLFFHLFLYTLIVWFHARHQLGQEDQPRPADDAPLSALLDHALRGISYVGILDSGLLFASAFASFTLQYLAVAHLTYGAAWSAVAFAAFYALAAGAVHAQREWLRPLFDGFLTLAALFITLAVPFAFDNRWVAATWGVQAALVYLFATRQHSPHGRLFALAVYALSGIALLSSFRFMPQDNIILQGSLPNLLLHLGAGLTILYARRDAPTAFWESAARHAVLFTCLAQLVALPLMLVTPPWAAACWGIQAAAIYWLAGRLAPLAELPALLLYALAFIVLTVHFTPAPHSLPPLNGPLLPTLLNLGAGIALLCGLRRRARPLMQDTPLLLALWVQTLLLSFAQNTPIPAGYYLLLAALLPAALQYRRAYGLDALPIAANTIVAVFSMTRSGIYGWTDFAALAAFTLPIAWLLQRASWQEDAPAHWQSRCNQAGGWTALLIATLSLFATVLSPAWTVEYLGTSIYPFALIAAFAALAALGHYTHWPQARLLTLAFTPLLALTFVTGTFPSMPDITWPATHHTWFTPPGRWLAALAIALLLHAAILASFARSRRVYLPWLHAFGFNLYPLATSAVLLAQTDATSVSRFLALILPALAALALAAYNTRLTREPRSAYHGIGATPLLALIAAVLLYYNLRHTGGTYYLPVLNFIELPTLLATYLLHRWWQNSDLPAPAFSLTPLWIGAAWLWASMLILRIAHHYFGVAWNSAALLSSFGVQAALSLAWACGAIILMLTGSRRGLRRLWQSGALLIGIVILKLFIVELGDSGGIARIISFIGVGVLLLAVSYFAPAPRKDE